MFTTVQSSPIGLVTLNTTFWQERKVTGHPNHIHNTPIDRILNGNSECKREFPASYRYSFPSELLFLHYVYTREHEAGYYARLSYLYHELGMLLVTFHTSNAVNRNARNHVFYSHLKQNHLYSVIHILTSISSLVWNWQSVYHRQWKLEGRFQSVTTSDLLKLLSVRTEIMDYDVYEYRKQRDIVLTHQGLPKSTLPYPK